MANQLYCGRRFRILTLVDNLSQVSLAIHAGKLLTEDHCSGFGESDPGSRIPKSESSRQWPGVHLEEPGPAGRMEQCEAGFQQTW